MCVCVARSSCGNSVNLHGILSQLPKSREQQILTMTFMTHFSYLAAKLHRTCKQLKQEEDEDRDNSSSKNSNNNKWNNSTACKQQQFIVTCQNVHTAYKAVYNFTKQAK